MLPLLMARPYRLFHFHDIDILPMFAALKLILRRPVVYDSHENYANEMLYRSWIPHLLRFPLYWAMRVGEPTLASIIRDVVTVVPKQDRTFPSIWFRRNMVQNFADRATETGRADDYDARPDACVFVGKQYEDNGTLLFLDVAAAVIERKPHVKFYTTDYFDHAPLRERFVRGIRERALDEKVVLLPRVSPPEIMSVLNKGTIGLALDLPVPHRIAALPIKLGDYMAAGLPIVAADLPNSRRMLEKTRAGFLVKPRDPGSFADAIIRLVEDRKLGKELGERGLVAFREKYNWESQVERLGLVYERLLREP